MAFRNIFSPNFDASRPSAFEGLPSFDSVMRGFRSGLEDDNSLTLGEYDFNPEEVSSQTLVSATRKELPAAQRQTGFSGFKEVFDILDIPGALVRGLVGAGTSAAKGEWSEAGKRLLSALPGSENIPLMLNTVLGTNIDPVDATFGSDILHDWGWKRGTTADNERNIRIAQAGGMSRSEATRLFGTGTDEPLSVEAAQRLDELTRRAQQRNPDLDMNVTWADTKGAVDAQDFGGLAFDIITDPLTYLTMGVSAAGKVAKGVSLVAKVAPDAASALRIAGSADEARRIVRGLDIKGVGPKFKEKLIKDINEAFTRGTPDLSLGSTLAEQSQKGQWAGRFEIPFTNVRLSPDFRVPLAPEVATILAQSDMARDLAVARTGSEVPAGVNDAVYGFMQTWGAPVRAPVQAAFSWARKIGDRTGVKEFDDAIRESADLARTNIAGAERKLNEVKAKIAETAKATGITEAEVRATVLQAVEALRANPKFARDAGLSLEVEQRMANVARDYAATLSRTGLNEEEIAPIAAGMAAINEGLLRDGHGALLPLDRLSDESLGYMHRMLTKEGREHVRRNAASFHAKTGMEFDAKSGMFKGRLGRWQGRTIKSINDEMENALGKGVKFFSEDPIEATRYAIHETHRRVGNAYAVTRVAEQFGHGAGGDAVELVLESALERLAGKLDKAEELLGKARQARSAWEAGRKETRAAARQAGREAEAAPQAAQAAADIGSAPKDLRASLKVEKDLRKMFPGAEDIADNAEDAMRGMAQAVSERVSAGPTARSGTLLSRDAQRRANEATDRFYAAYQGATDTKGYRAAVRMYSQELANIVPPAMVKDFAKRAQDAIKQLDRLEKALPAFQRDAGTALRSRVAAKEREIKKLAENFDKPEKIIPESEWVPNSALKLYRDAGLRIQSAEEAARLSQLAVPEAAYKAITKAMEFQKDPSKFWKGFEAVTQWMKKAVTAPFPAYHGRNFLENTSKMLMEGISPEYFPDAAALMARVIDPNVTPAGPLHKLALAIAAGKQRSAKEVPAQTMKLLREEAGFESIEEFAAWAKGSGLMENRMSSEFGADMTRLLPGTPPAPVGERAATAAGRGVRAVATGGGLLDDVMLLSGATDNLYRINHFLDGLNKGLGREGALNEVKRVFFDYRGLGRQESRIVRRAGFFYNFYRNNLRYMIQYAGRHPVLTKQINTLFIDDKDDARHSWLSDYGSFRVAGFDVALGFMPQQQFKMFDVAEGDIWDKISGKLGQSAGMLNPMYTAAANMTFKTDLWSGQPLERQDRGPNLTYLPSGLQDLFGVRETTRGTYVMDPKWRFLIDSIAPLGRAMQTQTMTEKEETEFWPAMTRLFTGIRVERDDIARGSISQLNENIDREGNRLLGTKGEMIRTGHATYAPDNRTTGGRAMAALLKLNPRKDDLYAIFHLRPGMARTLAPHIVLNEQGEPIMTRVLVDKMQELAMDEFPRQFALLQAQRLRQRVRQREIGSVTEPGREAFNTAMRPGFPNRP